MTTASRNILTIMLMLLSATSPAADPIFRASFDNGFGADIAKGDKRGTPSLEEVNLETLGTLLQKGVSGKALVTGVSGKGTDAKRIYCAYQAKDNIRTAAGTILLWVKPIDWTGKDKYYHNFFAAEGRDSLLFIYKYQNADELLFIYGRKGKTPDGAWRFSATRQVIKDWVSDKWQFISCTWGNGKLTLYLNGELCDTAKIAFPPATPFEVFHIGDMIKAWPNTSGISHIDEVEIYPVAMSREQVYAKWLRTRDLLNPGKIAFTLGEKTPVVDGEVHDNEYAFSGTGFFNVQATLAEAQGRYYLAYDNEHMYVGVTTKILGKLLANIKERDGKLWRDDSIEIFLMPNPESNNYFQFIFNANGVFLDGKARDHNWNISGNLRVANKVENGVWTFEAAIPFAALGVNPPKSRETWKFNVCRTYPDYRLYTSISPVMKSYHDYMNFAKLTFSPGTPPLYLHAIGKPAEGVLDLALESALPGKVIDVAVSLKSGAKNPVKTTKQVSPGNPLLIKRKGFIPQGELRIVAAYKNADIYSSAFAFKKMDPLKVEYVVTRIKQKLLRVRIKHTKPLTADQHILALRLKRKDNGALVKEVLRTPRQLMYFIDLPIDDIPAGKYLIEITYTDAKQRSLFCYEQDYTIPRAPPTWLDNKIGVTNAVPTPWTPMLVKGNTVHCWGRAFSFANTLLPARIESQGKQLLASNMRLKINGTVIKGVTSLAFVEQEKNRVRLTTSRKNDRVDLSCLTLIEYDGFAWCDLTITPRQPLAIKNLTLEIPCNPQVITLVHSMKKGYLYAKKGSGAILPGTWQKDLFKKPIIWVGDEAVGLQWFAQTLQGWRVKDRAGSVRIIKQDGYVTLKFTIIDYLVTLRDTLRISFGFMATPVRPRAKNWRSARFGPDIQPWFMYTRRFNYPDKNFLRDDYDKASRWYTGKKVCYYHALYSMSPFVPEMPYWMEEWKLTPPIIGMYSYTGKRETAEVRVCMNSPTYRDFYLAKINKAIDEVGIKHLYFDLGVPRPCLNKKHGCGWQDENGTWHKTYNIRGTREIAKRLYVMMKNKHPDSVMINHMSEEPAMPVLGFFDYMVDGELYCKQIAEDRGYYNVLSPAWFRAEFMAKSLGPPSFFIPQFKRGSQLYLQGSQNFWDTPQARKAYNHLKGYIIVHDSKCWPIFGMKFNDIWKIQDAFGWDEQLKFYGYWQQDNPVKVLSLKTDRVMCSTYTRPGKAMVIIMNDTDQDNAFTLRVNKSAFTQASAFFVTDAFTHKKLPAKDDTISLTVPGREFRIVILE